MSMTINWKFLINGAISSLRAMTSHLVGMGILR